MAKNTSLFFSIENSTPLKALEVTSIINSQYVSFIYSLIKQLYTFLKRTKAKIPKDAILVLSYYNQERRDVEILPRRHVCNNFRVESVDSAQGSEAEIFIISTSRPGRTGIHHQSQSWV
jgi:superfamily I DNA and/or RNA helicase